MEENLYPNKKPISTQAWPFPDKTWKKSVVKANAFWVLFKNPEIRNEIPPQILLKKPQLFDFMKDFVTVPPPNKLKLWHLALRIRTDVWGRAGSVCACKELGSCVRHKRN